MKRNQLFNWAIILCMVVIAVLYYYSLPRYSYGGEAWFRKSKVFPTSIDQQVPDSVGYQKYNQMRDSMGIAREIKNGEYQNGTSVYCMNVLGVTSAIYCDSCANKIPEEEDFIKQHEKYYLVLMGWGLHYDDAEGQATNKLVDFYVKNGQSYIKQNDASIPVKFVFSHDQNAIMVPVSKTTEQTVFVIISALSIIFAVFVVFLFLCFLKFLLEISKGKVFTDTNIVILLWLAIGSAALPVFILLGNLLTRLIFNAYFTQDVILNRFVWEDAWKPLGLALIFFVIYRAFSIGKTLTEEQELTI